MRHATPWDVMEHETPTLDRQLIGAVVDREMPRHRDVRNVAGLSTATRLARSTIYRVLQGHEKTEQATFRRVEAAFGWPTDTLISIGLHDLAALAEIGAPTALIASVRKDLDNIAGEGGRVVGGQA